MGFYGDGHTNNYDMMPKSVIGVKEMLVSLLVWELFKGIQSFDLNIVGCRLGLDQHGSVRSD